MGRIATIMGRPVGVTIAVIAFYLALVPLPGVEEALLIGAGLASMTDPPIAVATLLTAVMATRSWHVLVGASVAAFICAVEPRPRLVPIETTFYVDMVLGAWCMAALLAGVVAQLIPRAKISEGGEG